MKNTKELYLVLKKKYFLEILKGEKKEEYRDFTDYFIRKLCEINKENEISGVIQYDVVRFQLGYSKSAPQLVLEWKDTLIEKDDNIKEGEEFTTENCNFVIELGEIIEKINCESLNI